MKINVNDIDLCLKCYGVNNFLALSSELISKYFKLSNYDYYCSSWLLSRQITNILDSSSNIKKSFLYYLM